MKKSKIIIPALAMLVMSTAATVTGTVAWFTMNTTAKAEGMHVSAKTSGSLIIKAVDLDAIALPTSADKTTKVNFTDVDGDGNPIVSKFYPSTHDLSSGSTGLKYVTNGADVNFETGTRMNGINTVVDDPGTTDVDESVDGTELIYDNVALDDANYYKDYAVYLAGDGMYMPNKTLTITLDNDALTNINGAVSVDFYGAAATTAVLPQITSGNFLGTLNLAKKANNANGDGNVNKLNIEVNNVTIGNSKVGDEHYGAYGIIMRVYFDGALVQQGVTGNTHAIYSACTSSSVFDPDILYYSDANGSSIVQADSNTDLDGEGLYIVNRSASTLCFARSISFANVTDQEIKVTFTV